MKFVLWPGSVVWFPFSTHIEAYGSGSALAFRKFRHNAPTNEFSKEWAAVSQMDKGLEKNAITNEIIARSGGPQMCHVANIKLDLPGASASGRGLK